MTTEQILLFSLFGLLFGFLVWGKFRYDLVAFGALLIACLLYTSTLPTTPYV